MARLCWYSTAFSPTGPYCPAVNFYWHGTGYKPRVTTCLFLIIARSGSNAQCQDNDLTSVLWTEAEQASFTFLIMARSGSNAQCQDNDLTSALWTEAEREKSFQDW